MADSKDDINIVFADSLYAAWTFASLACILGGSFGLVKFQLQIKQKEKPENNNFVVAYGERWGTSRITILSAKLISENTDVATGYHIQ